MHELLRAVEAPENVCEVVVGHVYDNIEPEEASCLQWNCKWEGDPEVLSDEKISSNSPPSCHSDHDAHQTVLELIHAHANAGFPPRVKICDFSLLSICSCREAEGWVGERKVRRTLTGLSSPNAREVGASRGFKLNFLFTTLPLQRQLRALECLHDSRDRGDELKQEKTSLLSIFGRAGFRLNERAAAARMKATPSCKMCYFFVAHWRVRLVKTECKVLVGEALNPCRRYAALVALDNDLQHDNRRTELAASKPCKQALAEHDSHQHKHDPTRPSCDPLRESQKYTVFLFLMRAQWMTGELLSTKARHCGHLQ
jgi:hypothetical protein